MSYQYYSRCKGGNKHNFVSTVYVLTSKFLTDAPTYPWKVTYKGKLRVNFISLSDGMSSSWTPSDLTAHFNRVIGTGFLTLLPLSFWFMIIYLFFSSADVHENTSSFWKHYCFGLVFPLFLPRTWVLKAKYNLLMWHPPLSLEDDTCRNKTHFISSQNYVTLPSLRGQYPYPISTVSIPRYSLTLYLNQRDKKDSSAAKKFPPILSSIGRALQNHFIHNSSHISWDSWDILSPLNVGFWDGIIESQNSALEGKKRNYYISLNISTAWGVFST